MLSSSNRRKARARRERSPFSSPHTGQLASPVAARRSSLEERRRPAGDFNHGVSPAPNITIEEGSAGEDDIKEEDEDLDEDGDAETTPLLPIFSAAHLGRVILL